MRLFALRGATSVNRNDAQDILDATTELMREIMAAQRARAGERRQLHLHRDQRPQRRVPRRRRARARLRPGAAAVRPRDPRAALDAARDPRADPLLRARTSTCPRTSTSARRARCAPTSGGSVAAARSARPAPRRRSSQCAMALEFSERIRGSRATRGRRLRAQRAAGAPRQQRVALSAAAGGARGDRAARSARSTAIPIRRTRCCVDA